MSLPPASWPVVVGVFVGSSTGIVRRLLLIPLMASCGTSTPTLPAPQDANGADLDPSIVDVSALAADVPTSVADRVSPPLDAASACVDMDQDGYPATECGGRPADCDDTNRRANPALSEVCDPQGLDEDCNPCTVAGDRDGDRDNDSFVGMGCFNRYVGATPSCDPLRVRIDGAGLRAVGRDCDDTDGNIRPDQTESCNDLDDNCNGRVDEDIAETRWYIDADRDGHGDQRAMPTTTCRNPSTATSRFAANSDDCDDADPARHVGAREVCDGVDNDCDGMIDEEGMITVYPDSDGDGFGNSALPMVVMACAAPGGTVTRAGDCNDRSATTFAGAPEFCDAIDNDCSLPGSAAGGADAAEDRDGDHHAGTVAACAGGPFPRDDCDDSAVTTFPSAPELCNGRDDDCDRMIDEEPRCPRSCASRMELGCGMTEVAGGTFQMGERTTGDPVAIGTYNIVTTVTVSPFAIDSYEVTVARFRRFWEAGHPVASAPVTYPGMRALTWSEAAVVPPDTALRCSWRATPEMTENLPINCVDYWTAMSFCVWDGGRLPTEAEWEYAARGRAVGGLPVPRRYPWGADIPASRTCDLAATTCASTLRPVGSFAASAGIFDLAGNVAEWAADRFVSYQEDFCWYGIPRTNPLCSSQGEYGRTARPVRGASVYAMNDTAESRYWSASRWRYDRFTRDPSIGFRCARSR